MPVVSTVLPLKEAAQAHELAGLGHVTHAALAAEAAAAQGKFWEMHDYIF